jgi:Fe2+ transport system protein FeoA
MSSITLAFSSDANRRHGPGREGARQIVPLSALREGVRGKVVAVRAGDSGRSDRLLALGVTPGAAVTVLQTFPGIVFLCDQTELAIERKVADSILIGTEETRS